MAMATMTNQKLPAHMGEPIRCVHQNKSNQIKPANEKKRRKINVQSLTTKDNVLAQPIPPTNDGVKLKRQSSFCNLIIGIENGWYFRPIID